MEMPKFKIGDKVICVKQWRPNPPYDRPGAGWKKGFIFTITSVSGGCENREFVYWYKGGRGLGIFESALAQPGKSNPNSNIRVL